MKLDLLPHDHGSMSEILTRRPGQPPSRCRGELIRVAPDWRPIPWDAPGVYDDCLPHEGKMGQFSEIRLYLCRLDGSVTVVARGPDGTPWNRNTWDKPETTDSRARALAATA